MKRHENTEIGNLLFNQQADHGYLEMQAWAGTLGGHLIEWNPKDSQ